MVFSSCDPTDIVNTVSKQCAKFLIFR